MKTFTEKVYEIVKSVPKGKVISYKKIAIKLGDKNKARAVGNVLHKNKDPEVPCHRVVNSKGFLSKKYAFGGIEVTK